MSEDIHKWSDGRYVLMFDEHTFFVWDNEKDDRMCALEVTKKLNELSEENEQLKKSEKINMEYAEQLVEENKKLRIAKNDLRIENERLKREREALESNVGWFAHQLEKHTFYSDDFLETLETIEGEETVEKIRERQNEIIKILKKEKLL